MLRKRNSVLSVNNGLFGQSQIAFGIGIIFLSLLPHNSLSAQFKNSSRDRNTDLTFSTGVQFTLRGTQVVNEFKLVDDLGFEYDTMSVLKEENVREELSLTEQQFETMSKLKTEMTNALMPEIIQGMESDEQGRLMEAKVKAQELQIRNVLNHTQQLRLDQVKNQLRIERYGAERLANSRFLESELGLSPDQIQAVRKQCKELSLRHKALIEKLNKQANEQLLQQLTGKQIRALESTMEQPFLERWKKQNLFAGKPSRRFRRMPVAVSTLQLLKEPQIRKSIELTGEQVERLQRLGKEMESKLKEQIDELLSESGKALSVSQRGKQLVRLNADNRNDYASEASKILLKHQTQRLAEIAIERETSQKGTVQCLCNGTIGEKISLDDDLAEKIHQRASKIQRTHQEKSRTPPSH